MDSQKVLKNFNLKPNELILLITTEEALNNLLAAIEESCPNLKLEKTRKEDLQTSLNSWANWIVNYHPENYTKKEWLC